MADIVQVLAQAKRSVFSKPGKPDFVLHEAQCVVLGEEVKVGVLKVNERVAEQVLEEIEIDGKKVRVLSAGAYELEYGLGVAWDDKELGGVLKSIRRLPGGGNQALAALAAARPVKAAEASK